MPAITADTLRLPRVGTPAPETSVRRPVRSVTTAPSGFEGEGFPVRRAFAGVTHAELDPFIHMDQMGEVEYAPGEPKGTPWHPHRGFETVTYMIDGTFEHTDSNGGGGTITNGDTQWMTAGSGILHIEKTSPAGERVRHRLELDVQPSEDDGEPLVLRTAAGTPTLSTASSGSAYTTDAERLQLLAEMRHHLSA